MIFPYQVGYNNTTHFLFATSEILEVVTELLHFLNFFYSRIFLDIYIRNAIPFYFHLAFFSSILLLKVLAFRRKNYKISLLKTFHKWQNFLML